MVVLLDVEEKEAYNRIVKNRSKSLGVFFNAASEMMMNSMEDED